MHYIRLVFIMEMMCAVRCEYLFFSLDELFIHICNILRQWTLIIHLVQVLLELSESQLVLLIIEPKLLHPLEKIILGELAILQWLRDLNGLILSPFFYFIMIILVQGGSSTSDVAVWNLNPDVSLTLLLKDREHVERFFVVLLPLLEVLITLTAILLKDLAIRSEILELVMCEMLKQGFLHGC